MNQNTISFISFIDNQGFVYYEITKFYKIPKNDMHVYNKKKIW